MSAPDLNAIYESLARFCIKGESEPLRAHIKDYQAARQPLPHELIYLMDALVDHLDHYLNPPPEQPKPKRQRGRPKLLDSSDAKFRNATRMATELAHAELQFQRKAKKLEAAGLLEEQDRRRLNELPKTRDGIIDLSIKDAIDMITKLFPGTKITNPPDRDRIKRNLRKSHSKW
jgi:hypothetical protein